MDYNKLKAAAETITMPDEMKRRLVRNSKAGTNRNHVIFGRPAAVFAALIICFSLSVTALAATGTLKGFFRDTKGFRGAVVGTAYQQATDEIGVNVNVDGNTLCVQLSFVNPRLPPYIAAEKLGIAAYRIVDANGKVVKEGTEEAAEVIDGRTEIDISLDGIGHGRYKLQIEAFVSEKRLTSPCVSTATGNVISADDISQNKTGP